MVRALLIRGMLAGLVAGLLVFGFSKVFGEPQVDRAIAFEAAAAHADAHGSMGMAMPADEPELVSRGTQSGLGLLTGVVVYCVAMGGLFALVFGFAAGRLGAASPRALSALLAAAGFVAVYLVPSIKYPANPPAVGLPDTIGHRTTLFFVMMAVSVAALAGAAVLRTRAIRRFGVWSASLLACAAYLLTIIVVQIALPDIDEVPDGFPAVVLWRFRMVSLGMQVVTWVTLGLVFGILAERIPGRLFSRPGFPALVPSRRKARPATF